MTTETAEIDCPHCGATGRVPEDFLTSGLVREVFAEWAKLQGLYSQGDVESYEQDNDCEEPLVRVRQDQSAKGCAHFETYVLPRRYFTRDAAVRRSLMLADHETAKAEEAQRRTEAARRELADLEARASRLRRDLSAQAG